MANHYYISNLSAAFFYRKVEKMHTKSSQISVGFEPMQSRARMRQFFVSECNEALKKEILWERAISLLLVDGLT